MKLINIVFFVFFMLPSVAQNNLIHNASFEDVDSDNSDSPCKVSQLENAQVWEDDHQFIWNDPLSPCANYLKCSENTCAPCADPHSPDWFKSDNLHATLSYKDLPIINGVWHTTYNVQGRTGSGFIGMFPGELVEQKFFNSNQIVGGKKYTFSMYVQIAKPEFYRMQKSPPVAYPISDVLAGFNDNSVLDLNVYLGKNKIKYQQLQLSCKWNMFHSTVDDNFKDFSANSIVLLKNFKISPINEPYHQWHKLTFEFECPSSIEYDYIGIEQDWNKDNLANNGYILIDDVSLVESCELTCYQTSGIPSPRFSSGGTYPGPALIISNLYNVEKAYFEIYTMLGQLINTSYYYNYSNGINVPLIWGSGSGFANGLYIIKLYCENDCGNFTFSHVFAQVTNGANSPPNTKIEEKIFRPCCIIDYNINNRTFNFAKSYQVKENIYVNTNVHTVLNGNLDLKAGKNIEITGEFEAKNNSEFQATIVECGDAHRTADNILTDNDFIFYELTNEESRILIIKKNSLSVIPNPTSGQFFLKSKNNFENDQNTITIQDILGKTLFSFSNENLKEGFLIDLKDYENGMYILKYKNPEGTNECIKIIKQD